MVVDWRLREGGHPVSEADILAVPPAVVAEVARLDAALDEVIPVKAPHENIVIGTWNLRAFADLTKAWETPAGASPAAISLTSHTSRRLSAALTWSRSRRSAATFGRCATC